ncbi:hypothetical protein FHS36_006645 [Streptomyces eurocidicus]|uniref:Uncharacterized protein n=1 Tax=Streptomyces eurocidicus TaxID=66423 RepID=A0A7W8F7A6_STREU|nr:hypothetical protein [Streptomyces eurocidicus]
MTVRLGDLADPGQVVEVGGIQLFLEALSVAGRRTLSY